MKSVQKSELTLDGANTVRVDPRSGDIAQLAKGAGVSASGKVIGRGLNFLGQVILARLLGPEVFGLYAIVWTILRIISIIGPLGLDSGVIRIGSRFFQEDQPQFRKVFYFSAGLALLSGFLIGGGLFLGAPFLAGAIFRKPGLVFIMQGFAFAIPLVTTLRVVASATTITQSLKYATYSEEISQPASELLLIIAFYYLFDWKLEGAVIAGVLSFGIALILAGFYMVQIFPGLLRKRTAALRENVDPFQWELVRFSIPTAFAALFTSFISWADRLLVGYFRSGTETGIYTTISLISVIFVIILSGVKSIFSPMIADLYHKSEMKRVEEIYRISTKWGLYVSVPLIFVILFASRELLMLFFGAEYASGYLPLIVLALSQLINVGTGPMDILLIMTGRHKSWLVISGTMLGANILVNSILIPKFGILGAAIGTASTVSGIFVIGLMNVRRELNIWPYDRRFVKGMIAILATAGVLLVVTRINFSWPVLHLAMVSILAFTIFGAGVLLQGLDPEDRELIGILRKRLGLKLQRKTAA